MRVNGLKTINASFTAMPAPAQINIAVTTARYGISRFMLQNYYK